MGHRSKDWHGGVLGGLYTTYDGIVSQSHGRSSDASVALAMLRGWKMRDHWMEPGMSGGRVIRRQPDVDMTDVDTTSVCSGGACPPPGITGIPGW